MVCGIGVDIVEDGHVKLLLDTNPAFREMTFSRRELELAALKMYPLQFFSGRFAAKEAVYKALNFTKIQDARFREIEILCDDDNAPYVCLSGLLGDKMRQQYEHHKIFVSISHNNGSTIAFSYAEVDKNQK